MQTISPPLTAEGADNYYREDYQHEKSFSESLKTSLEIYDKVARPVDSEDQAEKTDSFCSNSANKILGEWRGNLADELGLKGTVRKKDFNKLTRGEHPVTGEQMIRHVKPREKTDNYGNVKMTSEHRAGWDLTFSAPKSVSLVALVGGDARIIKAHQKAVDKALEATAEHVEARMGNTKPSVRTGKCVFSVFLHDMARPDKKTGYAAPDLHSHAFLFNLTKTGDDKYRSVQPYETFAGQKYATAVYRSELAREVKHLGYEIRVDEKTGAPEIKGITREYIEASSPRQKEIKETAKELGIASTKKVAHLNRRKKGFNREKMIERQRQMEADFGGQALAAVEKAKARAAESPQLQPDLFQGGEKASEAVRVAISQAGNKPKQQTNWRTLATGALESGMGEVTLDEVKNELKFRREKGELKDFDLERRITGKTRKDRNASPDIQTESLTDPTLKEESSVSNGSPKSAITAPNAKIRLPDNESEPKDEFTVEQTRAETRTANTVGNEVSDESGKINRRTSEGKISVPDVTSNSWEPFRTNTPLSEISGEGKTRDSSDAGRQSGDKYYDNRPTEPEINSRTDADLVSSDIDRLRSDATQPLDVKNNYQSGAAGKDIPESAIAIERSIETRIAAELSPKHRADKTSREQLENGDAERSTGVAERISRNEFKEPLSHQQFFSGDVGKLDETSDTDVLKGRNTVAGAEFSLDTGDNRNTESGPSIVSESAETGGISSKLNNEFRAKPNERSGSERRNSDTESLDRVEERIETAFVEPGNLFAFRPEKIADYDNGSAQPARIPSIRTGSVRGGESDDEGIPGSNEETNQEVGKGDFQIIESASSEPNGPRVSQSSRAAREQHASDFTKHAAPHHPGADDGYESRSGAEFKESGNTAEAQTSSASPRDQIPTAAGRGKAETRSPKERAKETGANTGGAATPGESQATEIGRREAEFSKLEELGEARIRQVPITSGDGRDVLPIVQRASRGYGDESASPVVEDVKQSGNSEESGNIPVEFREKGEAKNTAEAQISNPPSENIDYYRYNDINTLESAASDADLYNSRAGGFGFDRQFDYPDSVGSISNLNGNNLHAQPLQTFEQGQVSGDFRILELAAADGNGIIADQCSDLHINQQSVYQFVDSNESVCFDSPFNPAIFSPQTVIAIPQIQELQSLSEAEKDQIREKVEESWYESRQIEEEQQQSAEIEEAEAYDENGYEEDMDRAMTLS